MNYLHLIGKTMTLTLLAILAACSNPSSGSIGKQPGSSETPTPRAVPVEIERIGRGNIEQRIETTSNIEAQDDVIIYPKISGQIRTMQVEEGQTVTRNQILASIDDDALVLRAKQSKVARDQAMDKLARVEEMHRNHMISDEAYLDAKYAAESAEVAWKLDTLSVEHAKIRSPFNGVVTSRDASVGDLVQPSTPLFRVVDPKSLFVSIQLPERDAHRLKSGMIARVMPESLQGREFPAKVSAINPAVDSKSGTVRVKLRFDQQTSELISGMFVRVAITVDTREHVVLLPKRALIRDNGSRFAYVMTEQGIAEKREPVIGLEDVGFVEIASGIDENESIILVGQQNLDDGSRVYDLRAAQTTPQTDNQASDADVSSESDTFDSTDADPDTDPDTNASGTTDTAERHEPVAVT